MLYLHYNQIKEVPASFTKMAKLATLFLCFNEIETLPDDFGKLKGLMWLGIRGNPITELPESFNPSQQIYLKNIRLEGTNIPEKEVKRLKKIWSHCAFE